VAAFWRQIRWKAGIDLAGVVGHVTLISNDTARR
jgi:hypothetical protein